MNITVFLEGMESTYAVSYGLTWYFTTKTHKILIIADDSRSFWQYANKLGISIEDIDILFLLQGCKEPVRELEYFISHNNKVKIYLSRANNEMHVYSLYNKLLAYDQFDKISQWKERTIFIDHVLDIDDNVFILFKKENKIQFQPNQKQTIILRENGIEILFTDELEPIEKSLKRNYKSNKLNDLTTKESITIVA